MAEKKQTKRGSKIQGQREYLGKINKQTNKYLSLISPFMILGW